MEREELEKWIEDGLSLDEIGRLTDRHPSTVSYWLKKHGLEPAQAARHSPRGGVSREALEELLRRGLTTREIADELDRSQTNVRYWLSRHDLCRKHGVPPGTEPSEDGTAIGLCPKHDETLFIRRADEAWRCLRCRSEAVSDRRRRVKLLLVEEAGGACAVCGYDRHPAALQFHHRDPSEKRFAVASRSTRSLETLREEARKCVLLCPTCHAEVELGVVAPPS